MTLDVTIPADSDYAVDIPEIIRETREAVNDNTNAIAAITTYPIVNDVTLTGGQTSLAVLNATADGTNLLDLMVEIAVISGANATIASITNGMDEMIKYFRCGSAYSFSTTGNIVLLNPSAVTTLTFQAGDFITLYNDGGDQAGTDGTWYEVDRSLVP